MQVGIPSSALSTAGSRAGLKPMRRLLYFVLALGLGAWAQALIRSDVPRDALLVYIVAAALFAGVAVPPAAWPLLPARRPWPRWAIGLAVVALLLGLGALALLWRDLQSRAGFWLWLVSWPLFIVAAFGERRGPTSASPAAAPTVSASRPGLARGWEWGLFALIVLVAFIVRVWSLHTIPNGCQSDECNNALDALKWLRGAPYTPYVGTNQGQATLFTYIIALSFKVLGPTVANMRLVSAIMGTLTVVMLYLVARALFGPRVALVTSGLLVAGRWHVTFSRIVYELIMVPLVELLLVFFLIRALKGGRRRDWALAGVSLSLGLNTYTAFRVVPFAVAVFLLYWLAMTLWGKVAEERGRLRRDLEGIGVMAMGMFLSLIPLGVYIVQNWRGFTTRINQMSITNDIQRAGGSWAPFWTGLRKTLLIFHYQGDWAALNNLPNAPLLDAVVGILFVLGLAYAIRYIRYPLPFLAVSSFVIVGSAAYLSTVAEAPTARRTIGLLPIIYLLAGLVVFQVWRAFDEAWRGRGERVFGAVMAAVVGLVGLHNVNVYFNVQAKDPAVWIAFSGHHAAVGEYLRDLPPEAKVYLSPAFEGHSAVLFISNFRPYTVLNIGQHVPLREDPGGDAIYLVEEVDRPFLDLFRQVYPQGVMEEHRDPYGRILFITYRVPREAVAATRGLTAAYWAGAEAQGDPALQRREASLDGQWDAQPLLPPPFAARWEGSLYIPAYGRYVLTLTASGTASATLSLNDEAVLSAEGGSAEVTRTLAIGFHALSLEYRSGAAPGVLRLEWRGPAGEGLVPAANFFAPLPAARYGLVGYYYPNADWQGPPALVQRDAYIAPNNPLPEPYSIAWRGKVAAPRAGQYVFGTRSDDGSFVFVNGQMVVDNGGVHGSEYREGAIDLEAGFHDIEVRYFQAGGSREMQLWWRPPGGGLEKIPSEYLFPVEEMLPEGLALPPLPAVPVATPSPGGAQTPAGTGPPPVAAPEEAPVVVVEPLWQTGTCGAGNGQFQAPRGVAVDAAGNVYVADAGNHRIVKLGPDGRFLKAWGSQGAGNGQFDEPFDLAVDPQGHIVVVESVGQRLQRFTSEGQFLAAFGANLAMYRPRGMTVDAVGNVYVADTGGVRGLKISPAGELLSQIGGAQQAIGQGQPTDVAVAPNGDLYMIEAQNGIIWRVSPSGEAARGRVTVPASTLDGPHLAWGPDGLLYVTDPEAFRVAIYDADLKAVGQFGAQGDGPAQFRKPVGLAVGPDGKVYVVDSPTCRVQAFSAIKR
jgi:DNA-binding beta-propeller fold protein YncE